MKYTHLGLGQDIIAGIAGYYTPQKEVRLPYNGREVLYVVGQAAVEASCCGAAGWLYAIVPGYIVSWQGACNEQGQAVTEVEPVADPRDREAIRRLIQAAEPANLISFW